MNPSDLTQEPDLADRAGPAEGTGLPDGIAAALRSAVHAELDEVVPYVVEALRRNNAFDEINDRLRAAERRIAARQERPVITGVHRVLVRLRHLEFDPAIRQALEHDLATVLTEAGYEETGVIGETYDPARHDAIDGRAVGGMAVVTAVHARGLASFGDVAIRAQVQIAPGRPAPVAANDMTVRS